MGYDIVIVVNLVIILLHKINLASVCISIEPFDVSDDDVF